MDEIIKLLKKLQVISPDSEFKKHSLPIILSAPQNAGSFFYMKLAESFKFGAALSLATVMIIFIIGGVSKLLTPVTLTSLNEENINKELSNAEIDITLSEIKYYSDSINKVAEALNETAQNGSDHLNSSVLEREIQNIGSTNLDNKTIDELLDELSQ